MPVLAVSKNGAPLLPLHDHKMEGNVDYNTFNKNVNAAGYVTEDIGLVKNVSGPFAAGLADLDGVIRRLQAGNVRRLHKDMTFM